MTMVLGDTDLSSEEYAKLSSDQKNEYHGRRREIQDQQQADNFAACHTAIDQFRQGKISAGLCAEVVALKGYPSYDIPKLFQAAHAEVMGLPYLLTIEIAKQ
jgi:hypothetical protein